MKQLIKSLGGALWAGVLALSAIMTVALGFGLPRVVDTSNPWIALLMSIVVFVVAFGNGWKQRGLKNERDIEYAEGLERERMEIAKGNEVEIARITAEKDLEIDRRNREERAKAAEAAEDAKRKAFQDRIGRMEESIEMLTPSQMELVGSAMENGGACTTPKKSTDAALLKSKGVFEELSVADAAKSHWRLSDPAMEALSSNPKLKAEVGDASILAKDARLKESFAHASYLQKLLAMFCYRNGVAEITDILFDLVYSGEFFGYSNIEDDSKSIFLKDEAKGMIDRNQDILEFCSPEGDVDQWIKDEIKKQDRRCW